MEPAELCFLASRLYPHGMDSGEDGVPGSSESDLRKFGAAAGVGSVFVGFRN